MNWQAIEAVAVFCGAIINAATFAYFYGRLAQRVDDIDRRTSRLEKLQDVRIAT